jgi:hypothetical protein
MNELCYFCNEPLLLLRYNFSLYCDKHDLGNEIVTDNRIHYINRMTSTPNILGCIFFDIYHKEDWYEFRFDFSKQISLIRNYMPGDIIVSIPGIASWTPENARQKLQTILTFQ